MKISRYTSNGHSHPSLRKKATELKKENSNLSLNQAKNEIAAKIGFKNWRSIEKEKVNKERDLFFKRAFSNRKDFEHLYQDFLKKTSLEQSMDAYRVFVVELYKEQQSKLEDEGFDIKLYSENLLKEVVARLKTFGSSSLFPHELPDYLFDAMIEAFDVFFNEENLENGPPLVPMQIIIILRGAYETSQNNDWDGTFTASEDEFF